MSKLHVVFDERFTTRALGGAVSLVLARGQQRLAAYYRAQPIYRAPVSDRDLFEGCHFLSATDGSHPRRGIHFKGQLSVEERPPPRLSQEKGEAVIKGPIPAPRTFLRNGTDVLMEQTEPGLINGQANNEGTMNGAVATPRNCHLLRRTQPFSGSSNSLRRKTYVRARYSRTSNCLGESVFLPSLGLISIVLLGLRIEGI